MIIIIFLIKINLYHYCGERNDISYFGNSNFLCSMLPLINIFVEKILYSEGPDSKRLINTFALCEEVVWFYGLLWNEGYSMIDKNPNASIKYLRTAANFALLSSKIMEQTQEKQKELSLMSDRQNEIKLLKTKFLTYLNASCALLSSTALHFKQLKRNKENCLHETLVTEISNSLIPKIRECIDISSNNILSQQSLSSISFALEIKCQKWYKDLIQECKDIHKTAILLLLDVTAFIRSSSIGAVISDIIDSKDQHEGIDLLLDSYCILETHKLSDDCMKILQETVKSILVMLDKQECTALLPKLFLCYQKLIDFASCRVEGSQHCIQFLKTCAGLLEQYGRNFESEEVFLYLISKAWNCGVDEYDNERDQQAKDLFLIASALLEIFKSTHPNSQNCIKLQATIDALPKNSLFI